MKVFWQAIRAVTVEMMGVGVVLWLLFGTASWTTGTSEPPQQQSPTLLDTIALRAFWDSAGTGSAFSGRPGRGVGGEESTQPALDWLVRHEASPTHGDGKDEWRKVVARLHGRVEREHLAAADRWNN